jgi:hypothetical protein
MFSRLMQEVVCVHIPTLCMAESSQSLTPVTYRCVGGWRSGRRLFILTVGLFILRRELNNASVKRFLIHTWLAVNK